MVLRAHLKSQHLGGRSVRVRGHPSLQSEFQDSQDYVERLSKKQKQKPKTNKQTKKHYRVRVIDRQTDRQTGKQSS